MWHTSRGERTLGGEEAALLSTAIDRMIDALMVHIDDDIEDTAAGCESGIAVFDAFSPAQRIGLLHDVAKYLLTQTDSAPAPTAALDATVAAIFVEVRDQVAIEIDFFSEQAEDDMDDGEGNTPTWRQLVLAAFETVFDAPLGKNPGGRSQNGHHRECNALGDQLPDESCKDIRQWEPLVNALSDAILWDRDFEMAESFLDTDPRVSQQRRRLLGIHEDYFTRVAPDPRSDEVFDLISRTRDIVRAKPR